MNEMQLFLEIVFYFVLIPAVLAFLLTFGKHKK